VVEDPGMCRQSLRGNREASRLTSGRGPYWSVSGRRGAVADGEGAVLATMIDKTPDARSLIPP
jgi:hypothetical protein